MTKVSLDHLKSPDEAQSEETAPLVATQQVLAESGKTSVGIIELPFGYVDLQRQVHKTAHIRELTGYEEDILANNKISFEQRMQKILAACIESIGSYDKKQLNWQGIVNSLPIVDRTWALLQIRILTHGPIFSVKVRCQEPSCQKYAVQNIDLNELIAPVIEDDHQRVRSGVLPKSGLSYTLRMFTAEDEVKVEKQFAKSPEDIISQVIGLRLLKLGEQVSPINMSLIKGLSIVDRRELRKTIEQMEGSIDTSIECVCPHCDTEFKETINLGDPAFFFPSGT